MQRKSYEVKFHETDCLNRLKSSVLLNFMQDIAAENAEKMGFGYSKIKDKNIGWFLTKYHIKLFKPLINEGRLDIETESKGSLKITCIRDFDIFNVKNEKIGEATSSWVVADLATGGILPPSEVFDTLPPADRHSLRSTFPKILQPEKSDFEEKITAKYSDLDLNRHVNNAIYISWAEDILPLEILNNSYISEIEINYKKQVKLGDIVTVSADFDRENYVFTEAITTEQNEVVCLIKQKRTKY